MCCQTGAAEANRIHGPIQEESRFGIYDVRWDVGRWNEQGVDKRAGLA
jgi:hypothetical protein